MVDPTLANYGLRFEIREDETTNEPILVDTSTGDVLRITPTNESIDTLNSDVDTLNSDVDTLNADVSALENLKADLTEAGGVLVASQVPPSITIEDVNFSDANESVVTHATASGTVTIDLAQGNVHRVEAVDNITFAFSNVTTSPAGNSLSVYVTDDDGAGPYTLSWPTSVVWDGGDPVGEVAATSNVEVSLLTDDGGTEWRGRLSGEAFA